MTSTRLAPQRCPSCTTVVDAHTDAFGDAQPKPGDLSVCFYCAAILTYSDRLDLIEVPEPRRSELLAESEQLADVVGVVLTSIATNPSHPTIDPEVGDR